VMDARTTERMGHLLPDMIADLEAHEKCRVRRVRHPSQLWNRV
jgi:hypothetical protein